MKIKFVLIFIFTFILMSYNVPKSILKKVDKEIKSTFNIETYHLKGVEIPSEVLNQLPSSFTQDNFFKIEKETALLGFAYISKAPSKTDNFDYLVILDTNLVVIKTKVLVYREDYGGEIASKRWLKQFVGKTNDDELIYGSNIAAISGATISVRSMTTAMNNLLKSLKIIHSKNIL